MSCAASTSCCRRTRTRNAGASYWASSSAAWRCCSKSRSTTSLGFDSRCVSSRYLDDLFRGDRAEPAVWQTHWGALEAGALQRDFEQFMHGHATDLLTLPFSAPVVSEPRERSMSASEVHVLWAELRDPTDPQRGRDLARARGRPAQRRGVPAASIPWPIEALGFDERCSRHRRSVSLGARRAALFAGQGEVRERAERARAPAGFARVGSTSREHSAPVSARAGAVRGVACRTCGGHCRSSTTARAGLDLAQLWARSDCVVFRSRADLCDARVLFRTARARTAADPNRECSALTWWTSCAADLPGVARAAPSVKWEPSAGCCGGL